MKKFSLIAIIMLVASVAAGAQGMEDALRYSEQFYVGSARTMAMGNAFTALGGDLGALGINPASSALYNCCEFAVSGGFSWNNTSSTFNGTEDTYANSVRKTRFTLPNMNVVFSLPTGRDYGLVSYSFGFGFNKTANFNSRTYFGGWDGATSLLGNIAAGLETVDRSYLLADDAFDVGYCTNQEILAFDAYLVNPYHDMADSYIGATENEWTDGLGVENPLFKSYNRTTGGGLYDMHFNYGMNFNDRLYLGANLNFKIVDYNEDLWYGEEAQKGDWFDSGFQSMKYNYWQETSGAGVNLQLGAIWVPTDYLRLGVSYTTPTLYTLTDSWEEKMSSTFPEGLPEYKSVENSSGLKSYEYNLRAPSRLSLGAALVFGRSGLISADLERVNLSKMRLSDNYGYADTFNDVNDDIAQYCSSCNIFRLGGEMNIVNDIALRAGYTGYFYNVPGYQYVSFGIGKRISENSSLDLAFRTSLADNYNMKPYDDYAFDADGNAACIAPTAGISATFKDLLLTYRVKF